jgi:WD40 repeat protein
MTARCDTVNQHGNCSSLFNLYRKLTCDNADAIVIAIMAKKSSGQKSQKPTEIVSNVSGGIEFTSDRTDITGDVVGRDKKIDATTYIEHATFVAPVPAAPAVDESPAPGEPPFKGLQYFDTVDADLFFGREALTAKLVGRVRDQRFLAVVGASGSGKSSVVRAGLIPALKTSEPLIDGTLPPTSSARWPMHVITPTAHPLETLAASLTRDSESVTATATLMDDLTRDPRSLHLAVRKVLSRTSADHLLLVVDQFEELFTLCRSETERKAFVDNLLTAVDAGEGPTIIVITLRADFYAHCAQFDNLREALAQQQEYIGPMSTVELRRAIEEPAERNGWEFEPGLIDLLLRDVGSEPGALPLLSHALLETWQRRRGHTLTLEGYHEAGGVRGAIAKTAETVFKQLKPDQQIIARNIFLRLTELGEGTQDTRRRAPLTELLARPEDAPSIEAVLKTLTDARLITTGEGTAEVAHEALIREWPTLRQWLDADREGLRVQRQLTEDAQDWLALRRDPGALYRGVRLVAANDLAKEHTAELSALEQEFVTASRSQQVNELEATQQRAAQLRRRALYLLGAFGLALVAAAVAVVFGIRSDATQKLSRSRELAAVAVNQINIDPERGLLIAIEAAQTATAFESQDALRQLLATAPLRILRGHEDTVWDAAFSPDGKYVVTASDDHTARVWDALTGQAVAVLRGHEDSGSAAFSPDGKYVVMNDGDHTARVWEALTGQAVAVLRGHEDAVTSAVFSPDGKYIVTASWDKTALVWEALTGQAVAVLHGHEDWVTSAAFSPDGKYVVTDSRDNTARVWDALTGQAVAVLRGPTGQVNSVAFSPDGKYIVTANSDQTARVWDALTGQAVAVLRGHTGEVNNAAFSPDGKYVVTASADETARVWDTLTGQAVVVLRGHEDTVWDAAFSPDGKYVVTASRDQTARIYLFPMEDLIAAAKARVSRELTCAERVQYLNESLVCATPTPVVTPTALP